MAQLAGALQVAGDVDVVIPGVADLQAAMAAAADEHGLTYIGPGYTADVDLSDPRPGENVIARGLGQAFIDLMVLLTEARGGRYDDSTGLLTCHPSGNEPILYVGSRRGVRYHAKLGYTVPGATPVPTRYLTTEALDQLGPGLLDYTTQVQPLSDKELTFAHYQPLDRSLARHTQVALDISACFQGTYVGVGGGGPCGHPQWRTAY